MILGIDTSGTALGLALCKDGKITASLLTKPGLRHGEILQQNIDSFLHDNGFSLSDLTAIAVTLGPGSFTGLRIGLAAAKGYAFALNLPLTGISTLLAGAYKFSDFSKEVVVIIDARREEFYYATFDCSKKLPVRLTEDKAGKLESVLKSTDSDIIIFGPSHLKEHFVAETGQSDYYISDDYNLAEAAALAGEGQIAAGDILDRANAVPCYIRTGF